MNYLFWTCWIIEMILVFFWISSELKLKYLSPNPYSFLSLLYLATAFLLRRGMGLEKISATMVIVPAIPLLAMALFVIIHTLSGGKWN